MASDGMRCSQAHNIVYSLAVLESGYAIPFPSRRRAVPEQDPIPPRRAARRRSPGEDDDVPPWANLPPVRPPRRDAPVRPGQDSFRDGTVRPEQAPRRDQQPFPGQVPPRREPRPQYEPPSAYDSGQRMAAGYRGQPASAPAPAPGPGSPLGPASPPSAPNPGNPAGRGPFQPPGPGYASDSAGLPDEAATFAADDDEVPSGRPRALGARASRALLRRRRRSLLMAAAAVVVIATVISVVLLNQGGGQAANISSDFITSFQPGELRSVPDACDIVPAATVQQYLPGQAARTASQPTNTVLTSGSACNWTVDHQPTYRILEVNLLAYAPNLLPAGNGSATSVATDAYDTQYQRFQTPPKDSVSGQATVTPLTGTGDAAFTAMQVFHVGGAVSDTATVVIRFRNVIVQAQLSGLVHANKGHYDPVSQAELSQGALAFAQAAYAALH